ncbi:MAG: glutathione synthase [Pseudomonadales bacterium]|nr:glutathione synthase [Pseudomonadales bacterium]
MTVKLAVVMDPIDKINYKKDSTLAMLWAAASRKWQLFYLEQNDLYLENGESRGLARPLEVFQNPDNYYRIGEKRSMPLSDMDVILMRKDPPFDTNYIYSTYILEDAERRGALVVNRPQSLRDCNEKVFATQFPQCCPPVLVTSSKPALKKFHATHDDIILKPLDGMGGASIFRVGRNDPNFSVIVETLTHFGKQPIMAQRFLPEIKQGDKRILMIDGEPVPYCLARIPPEGETRGNLAAGGRGEVRPLSDRDRWICHQVGPTLREKGLLFVGLDVIGDFLTEINVTSPTCIREIDQNHNTAIADRLMDAIQAKLLDKPQND